MTSCWRAFLLLCCFGLTAVGQAMVEYTLGISGAAGATAGTMKNMGKRIDRIVGKVTDATAGASATTFSPTSPSAAPSATPGFTRLHWKASAKSAARKPHPAPTPEPEVQPNPMCADNPGKVTVGMKQAEVAERCGVPAMLAQLTPNNQTMLFSGKDAEVTVALLDGVVSSVSAKPKGRDPGVVVLQ